MVDYSKLRNEIQADPLARGYAGLTDAAVADSLNTVNRTVDRTVIPTYEIINATVPADWTALSAAEKQRYQTLTGAGQIDASNPNVRAAFLAMFAAGTTTRANLAAIQSKTMSRADELGLGTVTPGDVTRAKGSKW